ncbi:MAG TPA: glycosyltransferase family 39 protein [Thermoanaerobaculia bacterium]|nr:glycosyltransferase family 39 protein [Thermoanaerobaculia bacterium]
MWHTLSREGIQAPLDYAFRRALEAAHPSEAATRLPAVLGGTLTVPVAAALLARRAGRTAGIVTGILLAVSPFHVRYSQEARPYALGMLLLCLSLLLLDRFVERQSPARLALLYLSSLATAYALYVAALMLLVAGAGLLIEDAFAPEPERARNSRRFLAWSPVFAGALWTGFLPWWPVFLTAIGNAPMGVAPHWSLARIPRFLSFFGFGNTDLAPLGLFGALFAAGCIAGTVIAWKKAGTRFLLVWSVVGFGILEVLEQRHPIFDSIFHFTPAGLSLAFLYSLSIAALLRRKATCAIGAAVLALSLVFSALSLGAYFQTGRPDWRPLAAYLRATPNEDRIVTDTDYTQLCVGYYVAGPDWFLMLRRHASPRQIDSLHGEPVRLDSLREPGRTAWLVRMASTAVPGPGAEIAFPTAEGHAFVRRIDPR